MRGKWVGECVEGVDEGVVVGTAMASRLHHIDGGREVAT